MPLHLRVLRRMHILVIHLRMLLRPLLVRRVHLVGWPHLMIVILIEVLHVHVVAVVNIQVDVRSRLVRMRWWRPSILHTLLTDWVSILIVLILRVHFLLIF